MKINLIYLSIGVMLLSACAQVSTGYGTFHPSIITDGVELNKYEVDRAACESHAMKNRSNVESTNQIRFRECLISKGYKLMS